MTKTPRARKPSRKQVAKKKSPPRNESDAALVAAQDERRQRRSPPPKVQISSFEDKVIKIDVDQDPEIWEASLENLFGTTDLNAAGHFFNELAGLATDVSNPSLDSETINAALAVVHGIQPRDEIEAMLALQMVGIHKASMRCLRVANREDATFEGRDVNLKHATKLTRTYAAQMEALNKYRGKGQQKMTVEHVHVHDGGQAIVGPVSRDSGKGGGGAAKKEPSSP
tara:strand:- start:213 stop:890 length:678 start_codon:yes stop_codon:yes gene_type:complete